jgi:hypothetical protein
MEKKKQNPVIKVFSELMNRISLAKELGQQYSGKRDLYTAFGYETQLTFTNFYTQYKRQDIARAIIDKPVKASWRGPVMILEGDDENYTPLEKAWEELYDRLRLKNKLTILDKLTGIGTYGVLLLGLDDVQTREQFAMPVTSGKRELVYIKPFSENSAKINKYETDPKNPRYGLPVEYLIQITSSNTSNSFNVAVHYTRVIHVTERNLEDETIGSSRLEAVFNRLQDLEKLVGGSAEMFWRGARPGFNASVKPDYTLPPTAADDLKDQMDEYEHDLRRLFVSDGVDLRELTIQIADPVNHVDVQLQMIAAETEIPKRMLTGSERGELASTQDQDEWYGVIKTRREEFIEPMILRPLIDRLIELKILPPAGPDGYSIKWMDLFSVSEKSKAEVGEIRARALASYAAQPIGQSIIPPQAFFEYFLGLTDEQIELISTMADKMMTEEEAEMEETPDLDEQDENKKNPDEIEANKFMPFEYGGVDDTVV